MLIKTRVKVLLDIRVDGTWDNQCTIKQVKKQSIDAANVILAKNIFKNDNISLIGPAECISIIMDASEE